MVLYDRVADREFTVEGYGLAIHERDVSSGFTRVTSVFELRGPAATGRGEDVTYDAEDHEALRERWSTVADRLPEPGTYTVEGFSRALEGVETFPGEGPRRESSRHYRRWALESAALDLALREGGTDLATALDGEYDPVRFVVSRRLGDEPTVDPIERWLAADPALEFKLDPTPEWTPDLIDALAETDAVRILDLKGQYAGTDVDAAADPALYERVLEAFPDAVVEDPRLTPETRPLFEGHEDRVSWDAPITGVESVRDLPFEPRWLNVKPSRFGRIADLFETIEYARERDVSLYGGGQFELDVGREHLHALASLFYPDAPNDVAPRGFNDPEPQPGLPASPLVPAATTGLSWRYAD